MKLVKSLLLSSAAGITAVAGAQAADLPFRKAAPVEYVRVCDYTGAGYFYIPGSDTCIKIGGYAQANFAYLDTTRAFVPGLTTAFAATNFTTGVVTPGGALTGVILSPKLQDSTGFKAEGRVDVDTRTQTAYGTVRAYVRLQADAAGGLYTANPAGAAVSNPASGLGTATNTAYVDKVFVQFAGFTAGRVQSAFDFYADNFNYEGIANSDVSTEVFQYTATFGGGFSATISVEDADARRDGIRNTLDTFTGTAPVLTFTPNAALGGFDAVSTDTGAASTVGYGGEEIPDIVGVIGVDQAWGRAQLSAAYHQVRAVATTGGGVVEIDRDGYAVQAGVQIKLPMLAAGDNFWIQGAYQNGAYRYQDSSSNLNAGVNSIALGGFIHQDADAVAFRNANGSYSLSLSEGYSVAGAFQHYFTPTFSDVVFGSYEHVSYGNRSKNLDYTLGGLGDGSEYRIGNQFLWNPINNLVVGVEVIYMHIDQTLAHNPGVAATPLPVGIRRDPSAFEGRLRMERDF